MSIERINNDESNRALADKLRTIIDIESSKPVSEQDVDLIDECVDYIMEIENNRELTEEELKTEKERIHALLKSNKSPQKKRRFKTFLIAACLAVIVLLGNFVASAFGFETVSILRDWKHRIMEMSEGEKEEQGGFTIIKEGNSLSYNSLKDFAKDTSYDILVPTLFPEGVELKMIKITGSYDTNNIYDPNHHTIVFVTNDPKIGLTVLVDPAYPKDFVTDQNAEKKIIDGRTCYIYRKELFLQCSFVYNDLTYTVRAQNDEELKIIIENIKEY